jgi:hypothetical protein
MSSARSNPLRKIAEDQIERLFGDFDPRLKQELATSLVRQWITNDGYAGLVKSSSHHWLRLIRTDGGFEVGRDDQPPRFVNQLRQGNVSEDQIPDVLHQLNLTQCTTCQTQDGGTIRLRMVAKERTLVIERADDEASEQEDD